MVAVGKPINDISINGFEWLLDDNGKLKLFLCVKDAVLFLNNHGITDIDMESFIFDEAIDTDEM